MFHLSLSSKELFHSNLLAWLAEDPDTRELFVVVLKLFGLENSQAEKLADGIRGNEYMVLREYNNFDFCICEKLKNWKEKPGEEEYVPGRVVLVLENKFKSIPYETQLKGYEDAVDYNIDCFEVDTLWETQEDLGPVEVYDENWKLLYSNENEQIYHD